MKNGICPYNESLNCENNICDKGGICGWHPLIKTYRKQKIKKEGVKTIDGKPPKNPPPPQPAKKRERGNYGAERATKLRADGKCPICGKPTDRPDKYCCSACYARKKTLEKARNEFLG